MIEERSIEIDNEYGYIRVCLNDLMYERGLTIYQISKLTKIKYETIKKYYQGSCCRYDDETLAKICYVLNCEIKDIIKYIPPC